MPDQRVHGVVRQLLSGCEECAELAHVDWACMLGQGDRGNKFVRVDVWDVLSQGIHQAVSRGVVEEMEDRLQFRLGDGLRAGAPSLRGRGGWRWHGFPPFVVAVYGAGSLFSLLLCCPSSVSVGMWLNEASTTGGVCCSACSLAASVVWAALS